MDKENVDLPLIPEVNMSSRVELRRHSAGIASSGNDQKKFVVPHYLRASTGSCHDFCKYGRKNVKEAKEKFSMIKRAGRKSLSRSSEDIIGGIMASVAKQKASVNSKQTKMSTVKHSESVDSELEISDTNKVELPTKSSSSQKLIGNEIVVNTSKASLVRVKSSFLPKSHISSIPETRRGGISSSSEVKTPSKPTSKRVVNSPTATSERVKTHPISTSQMVNTSSESVSKMKQTSSKVSSFEGNAMELSDKHGTSLNPDSITMKTISSTNSSHGLGGQKNSKIKMKKKEASCKSYCRGIGSVSARKHKGLKIVPHLMNKPKPIKVEFEEHNNEAQEKTLYVIKMESARQTSQSDQKESQVIELPLSNSSSSPKFSSPSISQSSSQEDQEESEYTKNEFEEDACPGNQDTEYLANVDSLEAEENGKLQKDEIVCSEDKEYQELGVNFVETQIECIANADTLEAEENGKPQKDGFVCSEDKECQKLGGKLVETQIECTDNLDTLEAEENEKPQEEGIVRSGDEECQKFGGKLADSQIEYTANVDTLEAEENEKPQKEGFLCSEDKECQKLGRKLVETKIEYTANVDTLKDEENGKRQTEGIARSEYKECLKLGAELVETQIEKGNLRSLKFQIGNVLGDNATDVKAVAITGPEKIVLRHHDVQVKKDGQGLYNNVIEETASKLIETQKSKVKALIDAFETVISLEENRTSAKIVN